MATEQMGVEDLFGFLHFLSVQCDDFIWTAESSHFGLEVGEVLACSAVS